jgi:hypothetical protein
LAGLPGYTDGNAIYVALEGGPFIRLCRKPALVDVYTQDNFASIVTAFGRIPKVDMTHVGVCAMLLHQRLPCTHGFLPDFIE